MKSYITLELFPTEDRPLVPESIAHLITLMTGSLIPGDTANITLRITMDPPEPEPIEYPDPCINKEVPTFTD